MRRSRTRSNAGRFGSGIGSRDEEAEAEVAGKAPGDRTPHRLREAQFDQAPERIGLCETTLATETVEAQRS